MESKGHDTARLVAANLRTAREGKGISQASAAAAMRELGWPWHQTTVGRVESAAQPLSLGELVDLAGTLGVTLDRLTTPGDEQAEIDAASHAARDLAQARRNEAEAAAARQQAVHNARKALAAARSSRYPAVRERAGIIANALGPDNKES